MKIIYISNARMPTEKAHGFQICKMCSEFANREIEVVLWVPRRENDIKEDVFSFYSIKENFKIEYIKSYDFLKFHKYLGKFSFYLQFLTFFLALVLKPADKGSIIYTRNVEIAWLFKAKGYKVVYEIHSWPHSKVRLHKFFAKRIDRLITITKGLKNIYLENGFNKNNIIVSHDAVDKNNFDLDISVEYAREKLNLPKNKIILGYTGSFKTMGEDKGIKDILEALNILSKRDEDIIFVAVGGTDLDLKYYNNISKNLGIGKNVILLGRVNIRQLAIYQKAFDVLLMPYPDRIHYRKYMSPLKMFEYMVSKRPIVASDLPSIREVLDDKTCIFSRPDNPADLADKIYTVLSDKKLSREISSNAYKIADHYTWESRVENIIKFIKSGI